MTDTPAPRIPPMAPITVSNIGAAAWRFYVVDAIGQKLTKPMPQGLARHHAKRIAAKLAAAPSAALTGNKVTSAIVDEIAVNEPVRSGVDMGNADEALVGGFKGYVPAALEVGDINTRTSPYAVTVDFPASLRPADIDAAWPDVIERAASSLHKHQICLQQEYDLKRDMVMILSTGYRIAEIADSDHAAPGVRLILDPYTYGAEPLRRDSALILALVRGLHVSLAIGGAS